MAQNLTVTTQDPKVHFDGDWTVQLSGYYEFTGQIGASVSLTFPGTAIYWHATKNPRCGIANVTVDNDSGTLIDVSNGTNTTTDPIPAILFAKSGLSSGEDHTINITFFGIGELKGPYLEVYNFTYTQDSSSLSGSGESSHKSHTGAIVGGVVGGIVAVFLLIIILIWWFRRGRQSPSTNSRVDTPFVIQSSSLRAGSLDTAPTTGLSAGSRGDSARRVCAPVASSHSTLPISNSSAIAESWTRSTTDSPVSPLRPIRGSMAIVEESVEPPPPYIPSRDRN